MHRPIRLLAAAFACAGALAGVAAPAQAKTLDIVLAGDSYTSGNGAGFTDGGKCYRSTKTWGELYAADLRTKGLTVNVNNVACSGGVVRDLDDQIPAVTPDTDLVLLTIGGNDIGFTNIVAQCFAPVVFDPANCSKAINAGKRGVPAVQSGALARLQALKARLRRGAKVAVVSYPYLANPGRYILRNLFGAFDAGKAVRDLGDLGDQAQMEAGRLANEQYGEQLVTFVPVKDLFVGHEPNQDPYKDNPAGWIWEFTGVSNFKDLYHPKPAGHAAMAQAVLRQAGPTGDFGVSQ